MCKTCSNKQKKEHGHVNMLTNLMKLMDFANTVINKKNEKKLGTVCTKIDLIELTDFVDFAGNKFMEK